jgi:hypothetical protein
MTETMVGDTSALTWRVKKPAQLSPTAYNISSSSMRGALLIFALLKEELTPVQIDLNIGRPKVTMFRKVASDMGSRATVPTSRPSPTQ